MPTQQTKNVRVNLTKSTSKTLGRNDTEIYSLNKMNISNNKQQLMKIKRLKKMEWLWCKGIDKRRDKAG